jgi:F-type H+-transporting ATPase subunit a
LTFPPIGELVVWKTFLFSGPFGLNKIGLICLVAVALTVAMFVAAGRRAELVPSGVQNVVEMFVDFINDSIIMQTMGEEGLGWAWFLSALFIVVFFCNIFEIIPFIQMPATARMAIPLLLALMVWVIYNVIGVRRQGPIGYIKNIAFPPGVPGALLPLVALIELISKIFVQPFSLAVRLFANMLAGHLLLVTFAVLATALLHPNPLIIGTPLAGAMEIGVTFFEVLVSVLQAFIFTILTGVYVDAAMHPIH